MPRSIWKLHLDTSSEDSAKKVVNRCVKAIGRPPLDLKIEKYAKGGFMVVFELFHNENNSWSELVIEVIEFSQRLGGGWRLLGNITNELNGVLSKSVGNHVIISGLDWAEYQVLNEN